MQLSDVAEKYGTSPEAVEGAVEVAKRSMVARTESFSVTERGRANSISVTRLGVGPLLTQCGLFEMFDFLVGDRWQKYSVLVRARLSDDFQPLIFPSGPVLMRVDSGCETGQLFGDATCECRDQLLLALQRIDANGSGLVINIPRQDGRGMGLPFKLGTLRLQLELGVDTVESGALLDPNGSRDVRTYAGAVAILRFFGATSKTPIRVLTNNPKKLSIFSENGFSDVQPTGIVVPPTAHTERHLKAKQTHLGHVALLEIPSEQPAESGGGAAHAAGRAGSQPLFALVDASIDAKNSLICLGLDPDPARIRELVYGSEATPADFVQRFLVETIEATSPYVAAYKLNKAFFDRLPLGHHMLREVIGEVRRRAPSTPIIVDCKVGDTDNTMSAYYDYLFNALGADAIILSPYMGPDVWRQIASFPTKGAGVLVRTSNPGRVALQDVITKSGEKLWQLVLKLILDAHADEGLGLFPVVAFDANEDAEAARRAIPDHVPVLFAGVGAQGGRPDVVRRMVNSRGAGVLVSSARALLYPRRGASTVADAQAACARTFRDVINGFRHE